jgi:S-adenosylmethionine hydrolase
VLVDSGGLVQVALNAGDAAAALGLAAGDRVELAPA